MKCNKKNVWKCVYRKTKSSPGTALLKYAESDVYIRSFIMKEFSQLHLTFKFKKIWKDLFY